VKRVVFVAACTALVACASVPSFPDPAALAPNQIAFEARVQGVAEDLTIPGIAYAVISDGAIVATGEIAVADGPPLAIDTPLRFASVTKALTAVLLMRAQERGALSLDDSAARWLPELASRPDITVRHLAAHVSEGVPGAEYVYGTNRYAKLGGVVARAFGAENYQVALRQELITPLGMQWRDSPHLGAHAGLVSTVSDVALFVAALQRGELISASSFDAMTAPYAGPRGALPVGVGWFAQEIGGERVVWSFGQDDPDHSSALVLMVPDRKLALVMLANTDELSNPFRLMMGDVRVSPFATAFLDAYAPDIGAAISQRHRATAELLVTIWREDREAAEARFIGIADHGAPSGDDLALHFAAGMVATEASAPFARALDDAIVEAHPANRWALLLSGASTPSFTAQISPSRDMKRYSPCPTKNRTVSPH
jgi:CubicO group peptidase (beta-lactamase class C family)